MYLDACQYKMSRDVTENALYCISTGLHQKYSLRREINWKEDSSKGCPLFMFYSKKNISSTFFGIKSKDLFLQKRNRFLVPIENGSIFSPA